MGEWSPSIVSPATQDFLSLYTSKTQTSPLYRMNGTAMELTFSPPRNGSYRVVEDEDDGLFCNRQNVDDCVAFLNKEIMLLGMPSLYEGRSQTFDIVKLVNTTNELLNKNQGSLRLREELQTRLHRTECDLRETQNAQNRLKATLEQFQRELTMMQEKERQLNNKNKLLTSKLKAERDEVKRLQSDMQHRHSQYKHEIRKNEKECHKLKERLHVALTDKNKDKKVGMQISQFLHKGDSKRGTWQKENKHEEEVYRQVISSYEAKQKQLLVENSDMRQCLNNLQKELLSLLNAPDDVIQNTELLARTVPDFSEPEFSDIDDIESLITLQTDDLSEAHFQMPYELVGDSIEKGLKDKLKIIKRLLKQPKKLEVSDARDTSINSPKDESPKTKTVSPDPVTHKELEKLNKQVERYKDIVRQQEKLIQESLASQEVATETAILHESDLWEEKERVLREKSRIKEQKENFEVERKNFTDAAIRLSKERQEFEDEKARFLQNQFLKITPFNNKRQGKRLLPPTPSHTSASYLTPARTIPSEAMLANSHLALGTPHTPNITKLSRDIPSTVELFRTLGLCQTSMSDTSVQYGSPDLKFEVSSSSKRIHDLASSPQLKPVVQQPPMSSPLLNKQSQQDLSSPPNVSSNGISPSSNQNDASTTVSSPDSHISGTSASLSPSSIGTLTSEPTLSGSQGTTVECHPPVEYQSDLTESNDEQ